VALPADGLGLRYHLSALSSPDEHSITNLLRWVVPGNPDRIFRNRAESTGLDGDLSFHLCLRILR
jgi:hypothetical protein